MSFGQGLKSWSFGSAKWMGERLFSRKEQRKVWAQNVSVLAIGGVGGALLSLTGMSVGWMLGTMVMLGVLAVQRPLFYQRVLPAGGLLPVWKQIGQLLLAVQIGQQMTGSMVHIFATAWLPISVVLLVSLFTSVLLGLFLWRWSGEGLLTSLYAITPGGISNMPTIAQEVGANAITVSIIQTMRIFLVVSIIPFFAMEWHGETGAASGQLQSGRLPAMVSHSVLWTVCLVVAAYVGHGVGKRCNLPAPRLVGGIIGVAAVQFGASWLIGADLLPWYPSGLKVVAQIFLGASIGAGLRREMFAGLGRTLFVGLLSALLLVVIMLGCSIGVSRWTGLPMITAILAFAPGGVAEMAITAVVLQADASFVVAVQTLRLIFIFLILPPMFRALSQRFGRDVN